MDGGSTKLSVTVVPQGKELVDDAFVSVTSDGEVDHGYTSERSVSLTAGSDSLMTITVSARGFRPQTKVLGTSSHKLRTRVKLPEEAIDSRSKGDTQKTPEEELRFNGGQGEFEKAKESIESISEKLDDPRSVYREILFAHQSLCTVLRSVDVAAVEKPVNELAVTKQADSLKADINALEAYADLIASNLEILGKISNSTWAGKGSSQIESPTDELEQVHEFIADFENLPPVGKSGGLNGEPLTQFGDRVAGWIENIPTSEEDEPELLKEAERLADELDRVPSHDDIRTDGRYDLNTYYRQFGSWSDVIEASDLDQRNAFVDDVRAVGQKLDKRPTLAEYDVHGEYTSSRLKRAFGTWGDVLDAVGANDERRAAAPDGGESGDKRREKMLAVLVDLYKELGRVPKASHLPDDGHFDRQDFLDEFGGWYNAVEAAELNHRAELLHDIRDVAADLGHPPDTVEMDEYGVYDHTDAYKHFDTWSEAKAAAEANNQENQLTKNTTATEKEVQNVVNPEVETNTKRELLKAVQETAETVGQSPSLTDLDEHTEYDHNDVYAHFSSWGDVKELADVATDNDAADTVAEEELGEPVGSSDKRLPSSELAELYETFHRLSRTVNAIVEATDGTIQESPMVAWRDALQKFVHDGAEDWEDGYGPQQGKKSDIKISGYRHVYGDGEHVTEFQEIETVPLDPVVKAILTNLNLDEHVQSLRLPVTPDSGVPVPIFVESDQERETAEELLVEFPENPAADGWEWVSGSEKRGPEDEQSKEDGETDDVVATEALVDVSGITETEAESLCEAGFESIEDLKAATVDEISETDGISNQLALRIKADVGGQ